MAQEEEKNKGKRFGFVEVPTETGIYVKDNEDESNKVLDDKAVLLEILNKLEEIQKALA